MPTLFGFEKKAVQLIMRHNNNNVMDEVKTSRDEYDDVIAISLRRPKVY